MPKLSPQKKKIYELFKDGEWLDIKGYEGKYQVNRAGQVRSLDRIVRGRNGFPRPVKGKLLKPSMVSNGYVRISLNHNKDNRMIHRIVAEAFIPNPENKRCVNHIDGDKQNNRLDNLEWATYQENEQWSWSHLGKKVSQHKRVSGIKHADAIPVRVIGKEGETFIFPTVLSAVN